MRIVHLADTHLGYSAYRKVDDQGVNQRETDIYDAFTRCIDYVVQTKPDLVVHAGDLFDSVRPTNRAITIAVQQILRLSKEKIPFVVISGNHETPKLRETGNIFTIFEHLDGVYPIHHNRYETISLERNGETVCIHAIPQCQNPEEFERNINDVSVKNEMDFNLLLVHGAVSGIKEFKMNEFNEMFIPVKNLAQEFDYIALGHYHQYTQLQENAFYAGSTEHLSFTEAGSQKGCMEIQLGGRLKHRFIPQQTRPMIDATPLDCSSLSIDQVFHQIKGLVRAIEPKDKIIRIRLQNLPAHLQRGIDFRQIHELGKTAVHFEVKPLPVKTDKTAAVENPTMKSLADEYETFLESQTYQEKPLLRTLGLHYIQSIEEQEKKP